MASVSELAVIHTVTQMAEIVVGKAVIYQDQTDLEVRDTYENRK